MLGVGWGEGRLRGGLRRPAASTSSPLLLYGSLSHTHTVPRSCTRASKSCLILTLQTLLGLEDSSKSVSHYLQPLANQKEAGW